MVGYVIDPRKFHALIEDTLTGGNNKVASETRVGFFSGAAIAYVELAAYKPLPLEVFCTYHVDQSGYDGYNDDVR